MKPSPAEVEAAVRRLRGQLVQTPVIGDPVLIGFELPVGLRLKAECLQVGGSLFFRSVCHYLLRSLGRHKGLVAEVPAAAQWSVVLAARQHRLPLILRESAVPRDRRALLVRGGAELVTGEDSASDLAQARGYALLPDLEHPDLAAGLASLGWDLASELPLDCTELLVAERDWVPAIEAGLQAAGADIPLRVPDPRPSPPGLAEAVTKALKLCPDPIALGLLVAASEPDTCVLLSS